VLKILPFGPLRYRRLSVKLLPVKTEITDSAIAAARYIRAGGIVAFPTETVYGLGADIFNAEAVSKIFEAKQRPADNPLIAHIGELAQLEKVAAEIPPAAEKLIGAFFPGPLTIVLKKADRVPLIATAGLDSVGVRMPGNALANEFLRECEMPVVAPSANISGRPSPTTWRAVEEDLGGRIDCILRGEATEIGLESTVVDCTCGPPVVLRAGAVSIESLRAVVPETVAYGVDDARAARSPGTRHKHYAPRAAVVLVDDPPEAESGTAYIGLKDPVRKFERTAVCASVEEYAKRLFAFFRECDRAGIKTIYCQTMDETGIGTALMDRLRRAAAG
jgi:L-threonylcarbamoyladenylate synthase